MKFLPDEKGNPRCGKLECVASRQVVTTLGELFPRLGDTALDVCCPGEPGSQCRQIFSFLIQSPSLRSSQSSLGHEPTLVMVRPCPEAGT